MTTDEKLKEILEKDYYIPDVSELCVGFEWFTPVIIQDEDITIFHKTIESRFDLHFSFDALKDGNLFVKKLDVKDIESFGFKEIPYPLPIGNHLARNGVRIAMGEKVLIVDKDIVVFRGVIKNKSELKRLFKQLNIC